MQSIVPRLYKVYCTWTADVEKTEMFTRSSFDEEADRTYGNVEVNGRKVLKLAQAARIPEGNEFWPVPTQPSF